MGLRISRHLKILKNTASLSEVKSLYTSFLNEAAPNTISSASDSTTVFTFDRSLSISKPTRIYVHTLALLLLKKHKLYQEVDHPLTC